MDCNEGAGAAAGPSGTGTFDFVFKSAAPANDLQARCGPGCGLDWKRSFGDNLAGEEQEDHEHEYLFENRKNGDRRRFVLKNPVPAVAASLVVHGAEETVEVDPYKSFSVGRGRTRSSPKKSPSRKLSRKPRRSPRKSPMKFEEAVKIHSDQVARVVDGAFENDVSKLADAVEEMVLLGNDEAVMSAGIAAVVNDKMESLRYLCDKFGCNAGVLLTAVELKKPNALKLLLYDDAGSPRAYAGSGVGELACYLCRLVNGGTSMRWDGFPKDPPLEGDAALARKQVVHEVMEHVLTQQNGMSDLVVGLLSIRLNAEEVAEPLNVLKSFGANFNCYDEDTLPAVARVEDDAVLRLLVTEYGVNPTLVTKRKLRKLDWMQAAIQQWMRRTLFHRCVSYMLDNAAVFDYQEIEDFMPPFLFEEYFPSEVWAYALRRGGGEERREEGGQEGGEKGGWRGEGGEEGGWREATTHGKPTAAVGFEGLFPDATLEEADIISGSLALKPFTGSKGFVE